MTVSRAELRVMIKSIEDNWAWVIQGPIGTPVIHADYFRDEHAAQASAWRRGFDKSAGYVVREVPHDWSNK